MTKNKKNAEMSSLEMTDDELERLAAPSDDDAMFAEAAFPEGECLEPPSGFLTDFESEAFYAEDLCNTQPSLSELDLPLEVSAASLPAASAGVPAAVGGMTIGSGRIYDFNAGTWPSEALLTPSLLEASAGTGKTFSIKHLVLRLVVEHDIAVDKILVVTFTRAATAELSMRIREHFADALRFLAGEQSAEATEGLVVDQAAAWEKSGITRDDALKRLRIALGNFDNAAIYTIHGFCKKMLDTHAFSASANFSPELMADDAAFRTRVREDFLRRWLDRAIARDPDDVAARQLLTEGIEWDRILSELKKTPASTVNLNVRQSKSEDKLTAADWFGEEAVRAFVREAPGELKRLKEEAGTIVYDDLLIRMWETIEAEGSADVRPFVDSVRHAYRAVLIDEFQDTDPVQYEVFRKLFLPDDYRESRAGCALFFVGDPKQAIYSFRSADLNTYFRAREDVKARGLLASLPTNYRSSPALVHAVNTLFTSPEPAEQPAGHVYPLSFLNQDLRFTPVAWTPRNHGLYRWNEEKAVWEAMIPFDIVWRSEAYEVKEEAARAEIEAIVRDMVDLIEGGKEGLVARKAGDGEAGRGLPPERAVLETENGKKVPLCALVPGDIAILLRQFRNNSKLVELRNALNRVGIRSRLQDCAYVCETPEAEELLLILHAFAEPDDERVVRAARATRLMGENLQDILADDEKARMDLRLFLEEGNRLWHKRGVSAILTRLMIRSRTAKRLLPVEGGEQALTNYAHLIEILHEVGKKYNSPTGLIAWFEEAIKNPPDTDDAKWQIRLASDANLVTFWTIHKSKGLQYPVVYLPFAEDLSHGGRKHVVLKEHVVDTRNPTGPKVTQLTIGVGELEETEGFKAEDCEEQIRLAYVALTRAACRVMMTVAYAKRTAEKQIKTNAYWQLLTNRLEVEKGQYEAALENLPALSGGEIRVLDLDSLPAPRWPCVSAPDANIRSIGADAGRKIRAQWFTSSFTGLTRMMNDDGETPQEAYGARYKPDLSKVDATMLDFPRGTKAGDTLHRILELADFVEFAKPESAEKRLELAGNVIRHHLPAIGSEAERNNAVRIAADMLDDVLNVELIPGFRLSMLGEKARASELEFLLKMPDGLTAKKLGEWLAKTHPDYAVPGLDDRTLNGFLTGFIDLAFMDRQNTFWVLDWKSNAIAERVKAAEDYTDEVMAGEMSKHHYRLQYLIYLTALRRFLMQRLGDDFTDSTVGGAIYVFLRGVKKEARRAADGSMQGITVDRVPPAVLRDLDQLFSDNWKALFEEK